MKKLIPGLIAVMLMFGLLSCVNNDNTSNNTESVKTGSNSIDTTVNAKTIIVDVRTVEEWQDDGHAGCSVNYPLQELDKKIESLKGYDKVIVVCRSGSRADVAMEMLQQAGIKNVENKGAWQNINCK
ncbi:MAG: rhodanese-like domain-containing protein [Chitinophagaceae bacterium]|nr:rhodanese-like domain-containing protein [Chitinophagaceae bacterium]MBK7557538.1 rhodanese-like domain-containing protein [Chitinophagaceae bacterium]HQW93912.1 rhodanese-like domain-containing protein [Ferruginibacter sp.]